MLVLFMFKLFQSSWGAVFSFFAGMLYVLAFSPFDISVFAFLAFVIFTLSIENISVKQASFRGYLFGLGVFGVGGSWVFSSMVVNNEGSIVIPVLMTLLFCCFWAIFPAISVYLFVKLRSKFHTSIFLFPCIWIGGEYIRGEWVLNGFPWLQFAYSQIDSLLSGYIPIVGVYGTGFIGICLSVFIADSLLNRKVNGLYFSIVFFVVTASFILKHIDWTNFAGAPVKVTLIQGNIAQQDKWLIENRNITLKQYYDDSSEHWDSDLIIWPETAVPAYYSEVKSDFLLPLQEEAIRHNTDIITSMPLRDDNKLYNSVVLLGAVPGVYKKVHLLPFGEYLPWQPVSGYLLNLIKVRLGAFTAGSTNQPLLTVAGYKIMTSICYEDAFSAQSTQQIEQARFLVNVTNDGWFEGSIEPYQHLQIAKMRALESGRYLLRATNTGVTAIISDKGVVIAQAPIAQRFSLTADIYPMSGITPYSYLLDLPIMAGILLLLLCRLFCSFGKLSINLRQ